MAEDATPQVPVITPAVEPAVEAAVEAENWRKRPEAIAAFTAKREFEEFKLKLESDKAAASEAEALKRGEHEGVIARLKADFEEERAGHEAYKRESALENALAKEGVVNAVFVRGAIAGLADSDIGAYVESLKKENAEWFVKPKHGITAPSANPVPFTGKTTTNTEELLAKGDTATRSAVLAELLGK